ncbi:MAG: hypothetical protein C4334_05720 [Pyrinomonas sp.]
MKEKLLSRSRFRMIQTSYLSFARRRAAARVAFRDLASGSPPRRFWRERPFAERDLLIQRSPGCMVRSRGEP